MINNFESLSAIKEKNMKKPYEHSNTDKELEDFIFVRDKIASFISPIFLFFKDFAVFYKATFIIFLATLILLSIYLTISNLKFSSLALPAKWFTTHTVIDAPTPTNINTQNMTILSPKISTPSSKLKLNIMMTEMIPFEGGDETLLEPTKTSVDNILNKVDVNKITNISLIGYAGILSTSRNELADSRSKSVKNYIISKHNSLKEKITVKNFNNNEHKLLESDVPRVKMIITYQ